MRVRKLRSISIFSILCMLINMIMVTPVHASAGTISGTVFFDFTKNGKYESKNKHEYIFQGLTVQLYDAADKTHVIQTTTTLSDGSYSLTMPDASKAYVVTVVLPAGHTFTKIGEGSGNGVLERLSKVYPETGFTDSIQSTRTDINIGLIKGTLITLSELNVLEIQPDRNFELTQSSSCIFGMADTINLTQMSMPQFISNIDKINGKYDVVYVGNKSEIYTNIGAKVTKLPQGGTTDSVEYYSENDITNKRASDIIDFINSGQLIIFSNSVFNNNKTKLYKNFNSYLNNGSYNNVKTTDNVLNLNFSQLYSWCNKRPVFHLNNTPNQYDGTLSSYESDKMMNFTFDLKNFNTTNSQPNLMTVKLYLDQNGDGLFTTDEIATETEPKLNGTGYSLNYRLKDDFVGMMPWKIEAIDSVTGVKAYETGGTAFNGNTLKVRVLQLEPKNVNSTVYNNFSIGKNLKVPLHVANQYNIEVTEVSIQDFNNSYKLSESDPSPASGTVTTGAPVASNTAVDTRTSVTRNDIPTKLNGNYDMIVMGFQDLYNQTNNNDLNDNAINAIKDFIKTGQSVMFTHDTLTFEVNNSTGTWGGNVTRKFRDIIGQSRYYDSNNADQKNLDETSIPHDILPSETNKSYGFTIHALDRANNGGSFPTFTNTNKINDGLITQFPYVLSQNVAVASTHYQYFQLNLEDENVIPWYTLYGSGIDANDGRNSYYTYSKGNITFSGTGHKSPSSSSNNEENKLFVNTMIKASRGANHAPTVKVINLDDTKIISKAQDKFQFSFIANDVDGDALSGGVYINDTLVQNYNSGDIKLNQPESVTISKAQLQQIVGNVTSFTVKILVQDSKGAKAEESHTLQYAQVPTVSLIIDKDQKYLVGDTAAVKLQASAENTSDNVITATSGMIFSMNYQNASGITDGLQVNNNSWNISNVNFTPAPNPAVQQQTFTFTLNKADNYVINNTLKYTFTNFQNGDKTINYSYPISVKSGKLDIDVKNNDGTPFANVKVIITKGNGTPETYTTDENGILSLVDKPSGKYTVSLSGLASNYVVSGGNSKTLDLSYDSPSQKASFRLIDTGKFGLDLMTNQGSNKCLVGDTIGIDLTAKAHNEDESIKTVINNIGYSITYDSDALTVSDKTWNLSQININGKSIDKPEQYKQFNVTAKKTGEYNIVNTVKYNYLNNLLGVTSTTNSFSVRSGKINIKVLNYNGIPYDNIPVTITKIGDNSPVSGKTDALGTYTLSDKTTGTYSVTITLPDGITADGGNSKNINLSYDNAEPIVEFKLSNTAAIIKHGLFINKQVENLPDASIAQGFFSDLGVDFKVYNKNPDIRLDLDRYVEKVEFTLYKFDAKNNLTLVGGSINVQKVNTVIVDGKSTETFTTIDPQKLSSISGEKHLKIQVPQSSDIENHYILEYKIKISKDTPGDHIEDNVVTVENSSSNSFKLKVVSLPNIQ